MEIEKVYRVSNMDDALTLLENYKEEAELLAGGTDLLVSVREGKNRGNIIIDISSIEEMKKIEIKEKEIVLGSLVTFSDIVQNDYIKEHIEGLWKAGKLMGSPQIRNMATIGGNIGNGSAAADVVPPLLGLGAVLRVKGSGGERHIELCDFYGSDGKTALKADEMIISVAFSHIRNRKEHISFEKLGVRNALAISKISCAIYLEVEDKLINNIRIASGALGSYPIREYVVEDFMKGKVLNHDFIEMAAMKYSETLEKRLLGRKSWPYKKEASKGVFKKALYSL
ncbi:MAG: FAD binding domain-containing protein [Anaeromicrobium sp.]|uniref:FAD binding domain-containing protein n=1 Tax=Anaeromicrobium sp. TaxID=1929132 RepID=UPI0025E285E9|nr:FAD binding domain-containing protein [Anaeromicrobium sp.]MCT4593544.1 FAD binding domain-containing protein [Anaeromicrobium sp.]